MSSENDNITLAGVVVLFLVSAGSITLLALFLWGQYKQNKEQEKKQRLSAKKLLSVPHRFIILGSLLHIASLAGTLFLTTPSPSSLAHSPFFSLKGVVW